MWGNGEERKREVMREEGHLVVICVYGQMPFLNILDVTSQLRGNVDVMITNSGAFVSDAFGVPRGKRTKHAEQMDKINQRDPSPAQLEI